MKEAKRYWIRLNVIVGWLLIFIIDVLAAFLSNNKWKDLRQESNKRLSEIWNKA